MTKCIKQLAISISLLLFAISANGQFNYFGDEPFNLRWMQISGNQYNLIYPEGYDSLANKYLNLFEKTSSEANRSLKVNPEQLTIILHPNTISKESSVMWAPKRIDIVTTPYDNMFAVNWDVTQAIQQNRFNGMMTIFDKCDAPIVRFIRTVTGQQSLSAGIGLYPRAANYKGDALLLMSDWFDGGPTSSTKMSRYYRAAFLSGDIRTLDKWRYGSYFLYTPEGPNRGMMVSGTMRRYSGNLYYMSDIENYVASHMLMFLSKWNKAYNRSVGKTQRKIWRQQFVPNMTQLWEEDEKRRGEFTRYENLLTPQDKRFTEYYDFNKVGESLFATRSGMFYEKQLVSIENGKSRRVFNLATNTSSLSSADGKIYWSEIVPDMRWSAKEYSIIRSFDPSNNIIRDITSNSRFFNPHVESENEIVAIEYPEKGGSAAVILDRDGDVVWRSVTDNNLELREAIKMGDRVYATAITMNGCGLFSTSVNGRESWRVEIDAQSQMIENLSVEDFGNGKELAFESDYDDISNIYSYNVDNREIKRRTNSRFGAFSQTVSSGSLIYSEYDNLGAHPVIASISDLKNEVVDFSQKQPHLIQEFLRQDAKPLDTTLSKVSPVSSRTAVPSTLFDGSEIVYEPKPYKKINNAFNLHSWSLAYIAVDRVKDMSYDRFYQIASIGAMAMFQNIMGTFTATAGYSAHPEHYFFEKYINGQSWERNKWFHSGHVNLKYSGLYPVFELNVDFNDRFKRNMIIDDDGYGNPTYEVIEQQKPSLDLALKSYVPLNFSKGGWNRGVIPYVTLEASNDFYSFTKDQYYNYQHSVTAGARLYSVTEIPKSRLFPRIGFGLDAYFQLANGMHDEYGKLLNVYAYGYLPGFTPIQGLKLTATLQHYLDYEENLYLWDNAKAPRGYKGLHLGNYVKATADYAILIYLGDVTWPWLYYFKRLQLVPFFDVAYNKTPSVPLIKDSTLYQKTFMYSYGADALFDAHILRIGSELSFGVRYARTAERTNYFGFIFSTGL